MWGCAERARVALNNGWDATWQPETSRPPPARVVDSLGTPEVKHVWTLLLEEGKRMAAGRRESALQAPTGAELLRLVCKREVAIEYCVGRSSARASPYVDFEAALIAEPELGHTTVDMLRALPEDLAERYGDPDAIFVSVEEQE